MRTIPYEDGSKSIIFEKGDRVRLRRDNSWIAKKGESATIVRPEGYSHPLIDSLILRTDAMVEGNWDTIMMPPWELEPLENPPDQTS